MTTVECIDTMGCDIKAQLNKADRLLADLMSSGVIPPEGVVEKAGYDDQMEAYQNEIQRKLDLGFQIACTRLQLGLDAFGGEKT